MNDRQPVLLVDPFADERDMYATYMRMSDIDVSVCKDPAAVLAFARRDAVAAVVARIVQVGALDGVGLTRALKTDERTRNIPIIIITTQSHGDVQAEAKRAGCDRLLLLPCLPAQLVAEIRAVVRAPGRTCDPR